MADENPAAEPQNIRVLYVGGGIHRIQPGDVFSRAHLAHLGVSESDLLSGGSAELTDDAATVEPDAAE